MKPILWGPGKAAAVQKFAAEHGIDLKDSYFYADGDEDVALMYLVGNPRPTNPEGKMAAVAKRRGWPILRFSSRGPVGLRRQLRTLAGFGSMLPVGAGAVAMGVLTGSRRRGVNFFTSNFSQAVLAATGVQLNVIGKENLTAQRPAVFIFNHRNQVDPIISGALIRDNWVAVAKKELESDPIMGTLGKLLDGVFIDRDDHGAALETLQTVEERAKAGLSILMAPEGTRLDTTEVGPFKKGPFRIAMAAGIPIVPIVIRNAEIVASRNSTTINPGTVDVAVFPPIPVDDWTVDTLPERIAEVRQLYLDTLADWPVDELPQVSLYKAAKKAAPKKATKKAPAANKAKKPAAQKLPRRRRPRRRLGRTNPRSHLKTVGHHRRLRDDRDGNGSRRQRCSHRARFAGAGVHGDPGGNAAGDGLAWPPAGAESGCEVRSIEAARQRCTADGADRVGGAARVRLRGRGRPVRGTGAGVLAAGARSRPNRQARRSAAGSGSLPAQPTSATPASCDKDPRRARVVAGEPAKVSELRQQWRDTTVGEDERDFAQFVTRRAYLAMERAEYRILGPQYKSPRLVKPEILASSRFRAGLNKIPGATVEEAGKMLDELATGWSRVSVDLVAVLGRALSRGFDPEIDYDEYQVAAMRTGLEAHPAVLLFSHRSYIDGAVVPVAMQENRLPPVHVFAGINLSFGLMGPLLRRSGVIFIRRNIGENPLYKYVLREYVGYIVEKRFNLSWSIEGTRSRTGKMLPPKLGLLSYVADAYLDGRSEDILLQPVSISFDQLHETAEYAAYARGGEKTPEGIGWLYNFIKAQGERNYGKIYVRFPEAVSMRQYLGAPHGQLAHDEDAKRLALQKMSFEVAWRILRATPVTATGLVCALLLTTRGAALTLDQLHHTLQDSLDYLERKQTPMSTSALRLRTRDGVRAAVDALVQRASDHPRRRRAGAGVAHRTRGRTRGGVLPQLGDPRLPGDLDRRAGAGARQARERRPDGGVLGPGDAAARSAEIRFLLRRFGGVSGEHRRRDGVAQGLGIARRRRGRRDRRDAVCQAAVDVGRDVAGVLRGV